jgi:hypothetical protein
MINSEKVLNEDKITNASDVSMQVASIAGEDHNARVGLDQG